MLYPGLERLIQKGKAQYHTFCLGASGVGTIPCPEGSFVILTDYDWFPFIDVPPAVPASPAVGSILLQQTNGLVQDIQFDFPPFPSLTVIGIVWGNNLATQAAVDLAIIADINFVGWTCVVTTKPDPIIPNTVIVSFVFTTPTPGTIYNGVVISIVNLSLPPDPVTIIQAPFTGGSDGEELKPEDILDRSVHQLEFKSMKSRNHYIIRDDVFLTVSDGRFSLNCVGKFHRDIYLVHTSNVQINILNVPPVSSWVTNYSQLPAKSQEFPPPSGYGQGAVGFPAVRETIFDSAGGTQQYINLTQFRDDLPAIPGQNRNEFKVDVNLLNILGDPTAGGPINSFFFNGPLYPILNVGYVLVNMNYNDFVSSSNG